ncbi:hypothetical protein U9M48_009959, partial [Paspalum notatum var. saurae]
KCEILLQLFFVSFFLSFSCARSVFFVPFLAFTPWCPFAILRPVGDDRRPPPTGSEARGSRRRVCVSGSSRRSAPEAGVAYNLRYYL